MRPLLLALFLLTSTWLYAEPPQEDSFTLSTPEELATLSSPDLLIQGCLSPLSGQLALRETDLIARGAQDITLQRTYIPTHTPLPRTLHNKEKHKKRWDKFFLHQHLLKHYKGWQCVPHASLQVFPLSRSVRLRTPEGMTLDFQETAQGTRLLSTTHGISNLAGETPSGRNDLRNTEIRINDETQEVEVRAPDGTVRTYRYLVKMPDTHCAYVCILDKEVLPSWQSPQVPHRPRTIQRHREHLP